MVATILRPLAEGAAPSTDRPSRRLRRPRWTRGFPCLPGWTPVSTGSMLPSQPGRWPGFQRVSYAAPRGTAARSAAPLLRGLSARCALRSVLRTRLNADPGALSGPSLTKGAALRPAVGALPPIRLPAAGAASERWGAQRRTAPPNVRARDARSSGLNALRPTSRAPFAPSLRGLRLSARERQGGYAVRAGRPDSLAFDGLDARLPHLPLPSRPDLLAGSPAGWLRRPSGERCA